MQRNRRMTLGRVPGRRNKRQGGRANAMAPPEFVPTFSLGHKFRFTSPSGSSFAGLPITRAMLLNLYTMAATTTIQYRVITGIKLNRVRMWGQPTALGSLSTAPVIVEWLGLNSPSTIHSDTAIGVRCAYVDTRPPVDASNRWWSISGNNETEVLFKVSGPVGTIIDVDCSIRFADDEAAVQGENGTALGSLAGTVYWNYLDGFASKKLIPTGGVTVLP